MVGVNIRCCCNANDCLGSFEANPQARFLVLPLSSAGERGGHLRRGVSRSARCTSIPGGSESGPSNRNHRPMEYFGSFLAYRPVCWLPSGAA